MMPTEIDKNDKDTTVYEVEFKGGRHEYFLCHDTLTAEAAEFVIVQADRGEHIGRINRKGPQTWFPQAKEVKSILRHATYTDIQIMMDNKSKEQDAFNICKEKIDKHELNMKLVDVEYQFDGNKICFFFTADKRIDFRALVKDLAAEYRTRIELRQIGVRDEARRIGGLGVCGRSLCCKTFLTQFEPITSQMARDQNLSLSPSKISGLCGRLMCCLAYEEEFYKSQLEHFPRVGDIIQSETEKLEVSKIDIFNNVFSARDENGTEKNIDVADFPQYKVVGRTKRSYSHREPPDEDIDKLNDKA